MKSSFFQSRFFLGLSIAFFSFLPCCTSFAQRMLDEQNDPHIGYIYPSGTQRGAVTTITVGGQYLENVDSIYISGDGVRTEVVASDRPLNIHEVMRMRSMLEEARQELGLSGGGRLGGLSGRDMQAVLERTGITREQLRKMSEYSEMRRDPKIQNNAPVASKVIVEIEVAPDAQVGRRELRVVRDGRISAPLAFYIGDFPEITEADGEAIAQPFPVILNGQILPSETDSYKFSAAKGDQLVAACSARELIPHLADAVPGWFQAVMTLTDSEGNEVAYADDYRFNPDPVLYFEIPEDGVYILEIKDALYRGRQDFVYRITLGEIPFIRSIFPLGGRVGERTMVEFQGENLPISSCEIGDLNMLQHLYGVPLAYPIPFAQGVLPEQVEVEPNNTASDAMSIESACIVNGRIESPGDRDVFSIRLSEDESFLAEIEARRLNSPLDSVLKITNDSGDQVAFNNDYEDKSLGRVTHHADSRIVFTAAKSGVYHIHLGDLQNGGGSDYAYRLQLARPMQDFELRAVPSALNGAPGVSVPLKVYALRKDGFEGDIELELKNAVEGLRLDGARIPAGQEHIELTLTLPETPLDAPVVLEFEGRAVIDGKTVTRSAISAEDMMQAFIYHHLVPTEELFISNIVNRSSRSQALCTEIQPLQLVPGESTKIVFHAATWFGRSQVGYWIEQRNFPPGISIKDFSAENGIIEITLFTDASAEKGLEGNLLFDQFIDRMRAGLNRDGERDSLRLSVGALPAVPFMIK